MCGGLNYIMKRKMGDDRMLHIKNIDDGLKVFKALGSELRWC